MAPTTTPKAVWQTHDVALRIRILGPLTPGELVERITRLIEGQFVHAEVINAEGREVKELGEVAVGLFARF
jgi:hypothetical protein